MAERERFDETGVWHHVMNRGIAKRTIAETNQDTRQFFFHLTRAIRAGWFEVHAFVLLNTHFHLLIRSPRGEMWRGMRLFQNGYVRWFNRVRHRDGPLMRGRFQSKRINSDTYWHSVVKYIDQNANSMRVSTSREAHPFCSAHYYVQQSGPPWLSRWEVESAVMNVTNKPDYNPKDYMEVFSSQLSKVEEHIVTEGMLSKAPSLDDLDELRTMPPNRVKTWMINKAYLGDGTQPFFPTTTPASIAKEIEKISADNTQNMSLNDDFLGQYQYNLLAGLLRMGCGITLKHIAHYCECSLASVRSKIQKHTKLMNSNEIYANLAATVLSKSIENEWSKVNVPPRNGPFARESI